MSLLSITYKAGVGGASKTFFQREEGEGGGDEFFEMGEREGVLARAYAWTRRFKNTFIPFSVPRL